MSRKVHSGYRGVAICQNVNVKDVSINFMCNLLVDCTSTLHPFAIIR
jgi:hypothetical protein